MPTKGGLALYLDTTRETLGDYEKKEDYSDAIKRAYGLIENAWVQKLSGQSVAGVIFYLKNAYKENWKDRNETDITTGGKPLGALLHDKQYDSIIRREASRIKKGDKGKTP
jgi:hypothetical protein